MLSREMFSIYFESDSKNPEIHSVGRLQRFILLKQKVYGINNSVLMVNI
jgi:hypothetical protein